MSEAALATPEPAPAPPPSPSPAPAPAPAVSSPEPAKTNGNQPIATNPAPSPPSPEPVKSYWPEDWRTKIAEHISAGDKKLFDKEFKRLERITDPAGVYGSFRDMENTWATKQFIKRPGDGAKPEEVAEFHKALGVPEKPEGYLEAVKLENGMVIGEADKPVVDAFFSEAHKAGVPPAAVNGVLNWYFKTQADQAAQIDEADDQFKQASNQALQNDYGNAFKRKINSIAPLFAGAPGGSDATNPKSMYARLMGGRTLDGKIIGDDPDVVRWLVSMSQEINPAASIVEDAGGGGQTVDNEIAAIEKRMREDRRGYDKDTAQQDRYRQLLDARGKIRAKAR